MGGYPPISIITVSYNTKKTIEATILSVINQSYENIEYIIIDGGSTDGTVDIIKQYQAKIAYWVSEPDQGIYDAMNKGINMATGKYVIFIQAGDLLKKNILNDLLPEFISDECTFLYGNVLMKDINQVYNGKYNKYKSMLSSICQQAIFYHKDIFKIVGKHEIKYKVLADRVLNIKCFSEKRIKKKFVNKIIADYEGGGFSATQIDDCFEKERFSIVRRNFGLLYFLILVLRKTIADILVVLNLKDKIKIWIKNFK